ncbi:MAG TPA: four helix bundle protein [Patescibacteria group bacterium]|nr:four helix bundle protein [Patescibacteria group bacterium]
MGYVHYKNLLVWQKGMVIVEAVYRLTKNFPSEEKFGLVSQMRRSAISIPSNIAEGKGRASKKEFAHFVSIARGSLAELETQLLLSFRLGYIKEIESTSISLLLEELQRMLDSLLVKLRFPTISSTSST